MLHNVTSQYTNGSIFVKKNISVKKRKLDICVISDAHLGTYGCYANELLTYLSSIEPTTLILNGGMFDISHFKASDFPPSHLNVIKKIVSLASEGTKVYYIKGTHDEIKGNSLGMDPSNIIFCKKLILNLDGKKTWFFHGAIFDAPFFSVKWLAKLGEPGHDVILAISKLVNRFYKKSKKEQFSLSDKNKQNNKKSERYIVDFENKVAALAMDGDYDCVVCGHIQKPKKQLIESPQGDLVYLNSGDWVEHMSSLEYSFKRWKLYRYENDKRSPFFVDEALKNMTINELITSIESKKVS